MAKINFDDLSKELDQLQEEGLTFANKSMTWDTPEDVKEIVEALNQTKVVHFLLLEGNTLGPDAAAAIGVALEGHPEFRKALWQNLFTRRLKTEIPDAIEYLGGGLITAKAHLTLLDMSDNALGPSGMVGLEGLLRSPVCYSLQELRLNNCGLGIFGAQMLLNALLECNRASIAAGTPLKLKVFIAGRNRLENEGAKAIAKILLTLKTLEEVSVPQNSFYNAGIGLLAQGLKVNTNLRILDLNDNTLTHKGALSLSKALAFTPKLREINLGDCLLNNTGAYHLAEALTDNYPDLEVIDLSFNEIRADGGLALVHALQGKPNLRKVNLDGNSFGAGCEAIRDAMLLTENPEALETLDDESEAEEAEDYEDEEYDDDDSEDDEIEYEEIEEEEQRDGNIEEVTGDEDYDDCAENPNEESAYTTCLNFSTEMLAKESTISPKNFTFSEDNDVTTPKQFCLNRQPCSLQVFESLKVENKVEAFKDIMNQFTGDNYLLILLFTTLKCAHLALSSSEALELAVEFFKVSFNYAVNTGQERRVVNFYLIQMCLLRTDQEFNPAYNLESCRFALREAFKKNEINNEYVVNVLKAFLGNTDG